MISYRKLAEALHEPLRPEDLTPRRILIDTLHTYYHCLRISRPLLAYELWTVATLCLNNALFGFINKPLATYAEEQHLTETFQERDN